MIYYLKDGVFYCGDNEVFRLVRNDYLIYSTLRILDSSKEVLVKCRLHPWCSFKFMKIVKQNLAHWISIVKNKRLYYLITTINDVDYKITMYPNSGILALKLSGEFMINNRKSGIMYSKNEGWTSTIYYFEFAEVDVELINYCLVFFALRYYDIEDVA